MTTNHVVITTEPFVVDIPSDGEIVEVCQHPARLDGSEGCWMPSETSVWPLESIALFRIPRFHPQQPEMSPPTGSWASSA